MLPPMLCALPCPLSKECLATLISIGVSSKGMDRNWVIIELPLLYSNGSSSVLSIRNDVSPSEFIGAFKDMSGKMLRNCGCEQGVHQSR